MDTGTCKWCGGPKKPRAQFCCDDHRRKYANSACNPWHLWCWYGISGGRRKVKRLPGPMNGAW